MTAAITASEARKRLFPLIEQVNDDHAPVEIVSKHGNAVLVSKQDWDSIEETNYLLSNPANAEHLRRGIAELDAGRGQEHELIEE